MKWFVILGVTAALAPSVCAIEHTDMYQRSFVPGSSERQLIVENINGYVRVTGDSGNDIRITVREVFRADTAEQLSRARNDVRLEMKQEGGSVRVYLDGPFRDRSRRDRRGEGFHFRHDIEVHAPRNIDVVLKTVNGQEVKVADIEGKWDIHNVNGSIEFTGAAGAGSAETVNGGVRVTFARNPGQPSRFKTLNGAIDVSFQPDLSADLKLSIMNGEAFTDFDYTALAGGVEARKLADGVRYRISDRNRTVRVGGGGVEHDFRTLNGSIRIRKYGM